MDFLGIGPLELMFVFLIILIVLGPNDMVKAGKTIGTFLRNLFSSDGWRVIQRATRELRSMPNRLAREAGIQEFEKQLKEAKEFENPLDDLSDLNSIGDPALNAWTEVPDQPTDSTTKEDLPPKTPSPEISEESKENPEKES